MVKIGDKILVKDKDLKGRTFTVISTDGKTAYIQDTQTWERWTVSVKIIR
jgi:translation elongation factor P/translation initiation factor 5A